MIVCGPFQLEDYHVGKPAEHVASVAGGHFIWWQCSQLAAMAWWCGAADS